jgi:hypothetical protein
MLCCLLLEELIALALCDDLHHMILNCRPVLEGFAYDRVP